MPMLSSKRRRSSVSSSVHAPQMQRVMRSWGMVARALRLCVSETGPFFRNVSRLCAWQEISARESSSASTPEMRLPRTASGTSS